MAFTQQRERWDKQNRQLTVVKQQATIPERALKGSFIGFYQIGPHRNHKHSVKISFCLVLKALLLKYWETRLQGKLIQYNSAQNSYQTQDLSFQYLNFCGSLYSTKILHLKAKTATAAQLLVYIQFHNEKNFVEEIYDWAHQQTSTTPLPKSVCTQITMQPVQKRKMFTLSPLQLADVAMVSFLITARSSYSDKYWSTPKKLL